MNNLAMLIKSKVISFPDSILENYRALGLDETEVIILINLYRQQEKGNSFLKISDLIAEMSINECFASEKVLRLVQFGFITLEITEDKTEKFSIDATYEKLGQILEKGKTSSSYDHQKLLQQVVMYTESLYAKALNASELELINHWVEEGYSYDEMKGAILDSLKAKKMHVRYADAILVSRRKQATRMEAVSPDPEMKALLDKVYVKKKYR